jgi:hypothetical protein
LLLTSFTGDAFPQTKATCTKWSSKKVHNQKLGLKLDNVLQAYEVDNFFFWYIYFGQSPHL